MAKLKTKPLTSRRECLEARLAAAEARIDDLEAALAQERRKNVELAGALDALRAEQGHKIDPT